MKTVIHNLEEREINRKNSHQVKLKREGADDGNKPLLFVYVKTVHTDNEWWDASLELEIFPRVDSTKKVCKTVSACSRKKDYFDFQSFVKLDVHQEVDSGYTVVKKSKR